MALEIKKSEKAERSKMQHYVLNKISKAGGWAFFVFPENFDYLKTQLERLANGERGC